MGRSRQNGVVKRVGSGSYHPNRLVSNSNAAFIIHLALAETLITQKANVLIYQMVIVSTKKKIKHLAYDRFSIKDNCYYEQIQKDRVCIMVDSCLHIFVLLFSLN